MEQFPILGAPDTGDTAWMLASAALVLLMTPGLAFFYGGMVRAKGVLNTLVCRPVPAGEIDAFLAVSAARIANRGGARVIDLAGRRHG